MAGGHAGKASLGAGCRRIAKVRIRPACVIIPLHIQVSDCVVIFPGSVCGQPRLTSFGFLVVEEESDAADVGHWGTAKLERQSKRGMR